MTDILAIIEPFVEKALKMGADEVEFFAQKYRNKTVNFEHNNMKSALASIVDGRGILFLKNKALGFASSNSLDKIKIEDSLKEALAIAKVTPPEDNYFLSTKQKITKTIQQLIESQLVEVSIHPDDKRSKKLFLTIKGDSELEKINPVLKEVQSRVLDGLSVEEVDLLDKLLDRVYLNIDKN